MDAEKKQTYTRRIAASNKSELIVILYEIFFDYVAEAYEGYADGKHGDEDSRAAIYHANDVLSHLIADLNFEPACRELSRSLFSIYHFCQRQLFDTLFLERDAGLREAEKLMRELYGSFKEAAKQDTSAPLMQNTQSTVAGYTYGRNDVTEMGTDLNPSRGFLA